MQIAEAPPLEKVQEIVRAVDEGIQVVNVKGVYLREIQGKFHAWITRPQQHIILEGEMTPILPEAHIVIDPAFNPTEGAILGEFAAAAADLSRHVQERVAIANALIEP